MEYLKKKNFNQLENNSLSLTETLSLYSPLSLPLSLSQRHSRSSTKSNSVMSNDGMNKSAFTKLSVTWNHIILHVFKQVDTT